MYKSHVVSMCTIHFSDMCDVPSSKVPASYDRHSHLLPKFSCLWIRRVRIQHDETILLASRLIVARRTSISSLRASITSWRCPLSCIASHLTILSWIFFSSSPPSLSFIVPSLCILVPYPQQHIDVFLSSPPPLHLSWASHFRSYSRRADLLDVRVGLLGTLSSQSPSSSSPSSISEEEWLHL